MIEARQIPSADDEPGEAAHSEVRRVIARTYRPERRTFLRTVLGTGMAVGLGALNVLLVGPKARAHWATISRCTYYWNWPATDEWAADCNSSAAAVSSGYCAFYSGVGWYHRTDYTSRPGVGDIDYRHDDRCLTHTGERYNAWIWRRNGVAPEPADKRCSDGLVYVYKPTGGEDYHYKSTCIVYL